MINNIQQYNHKIGYYTLTSVDEIIDGSDDGRNYYITVPTNPNKIHKCHIIEDSPYYFIFETDDYEFIKIECIPEENKVTDIYWVEQITTYNRK